MDTNENHIGTTGEQQIAEAMDNFDSEANVFLFDALTADDDPTFYTEVHHVESDWEKAKAESAAKQPLPEVHFEALIEYNGQKVLLKEEHIAQVTSKTALRGMIVALVAPVKDLDDHGKRARAKLTLLVAARLAELTV